MCNICSISICLVDLIFIEYNLVMINFCFRISFFLKLLLRYEDYYIYRVIFIFIKYYFVYFLRKFKVNL